jgi:tripartite ATP-independent transporter DctM subunit
VIALVVLGAFLVLMALAVPVVMALAASALLAMVVAGFSGAIYIVPQQVLEGVNSGALLAVAFFILAGNLLSGLGMADRIYHFANALVGHFKAGLAQVNVLGSMVFAGVSGAAVADLAGLGNIEIRAMKSHGYRADFAAAVTAASSIVGPIIPPSIPLVIYAFVSSTSVGRLFLAGIIPGVLIGLSLMVFIRLLAIRGDFPTQPRAPFRAGVRSGVDGLAALVAPGIILGAMLTGYTTATEAGVLACVYSILVGLLYRSLSWRKIWTALTDTVILTALIMMMIGFSTVTGWLMAIEQVPQQLANAVLTNIQEPWLFLAVYLVFFLILGCVFDTLAAMIILMPILLPIVDQFGIDRIHFGLITVFVLMIGILTPPLGIALYILVDISGVSFERITKATLPFLLPLIVALLLVTYIPELSLWLPNLVMGAE